MKRNRLLIDLKRIEALPTLPVVALELLNLTLDQNSTLDQLARLMARDQALTVKILNVANSPFYRRERRITNLPDAIVLLGRKFLRSLVLSLTVFDLFDNGDEGGGGQPGSLNPDRLWTHCLAVAQGAKILGTRLGAPNPEDCFVAGLLHDVGKLVLAHLYAEQYAAVLEMARQEQCDILQAESSLLEVDHVTVGKLALEHWKLPQQFVEATWLHHAGFISTAEVGSGPWMAAMVAISDGLCNSEGYTLDDELRSTPLDQGLRLGLGLSDVELLGVANAIADELPKLTEPLHLPAPSRKTYFTVLQQSNTELGKLSLELHQKTATLEAKNLELASLTAMSTALHTTSEVDEQAKILVRAVLRGLQLQEVRCSIGLGEKTVLVAEISRREDDDAEPKLSIHEESGQSELLHAGSTAHVELICNGRSLGFISVWRGDASEPRRDLASALITFANVGALAIDQVLLRCQLDDRTEELIATSQRLQRSESQLTTIHREVARIERLKVLGEMAAGVLHDFNNTLSVLIGRAQLFLLRCEDDELRRQAEIIEKVALDASDIVSKLGKFGKESLDEPRVSLDLNAIVKDLFDILEARLARRKPQQGPIEVVKVLGALQPIAGVASALREALTNLAINAVDAMPQGGRLTISTSVEDDDVVLVLSDTGVGMSPQALENAFKPFYTTKGDAGTGLGLSLTRSLISRLHGTISMKSIEGGGTTVTLKFPIDTSVAQQASKADGLPQPGRRAKILLIESDADVRDLLQEILIGQGHDVAVEAGGPGDVESHAKRGYDLVISDVGPNTKDLFKLAASLKHDTPGCRVLAVCNGQAPLDAEHAPASIDRVIKKPFQVHELLKIVASLMSPQ